MRACLLSSVLNQIVLGEPLPFGVRDAAGGVLLERGQVIADEAALQALFDRQALVDADELAEAVQAQPAEPRPVPLGELAAEWDHCRDDVRRALTAEPAGMAAAIDRVTDRLLAIIAQAPELALSQVVRAPELGSSHYGVNHSIHAATACHAAARLLQWGEAEQRRAFQAALTMNVGMFDLQARLADQVSALTARQRETIREHPVRGVEMLRAAGIADEEWLAAVLQHHEMPDGSGYPYGLAAVDDLAAMLRFADFYTARMSSRSNRPALSAMEAGRGLHHIAAQSPLAGALIKSFGIFPPGSLVKLASGELGIVTRNGDKAHHPLVAILTEPTGESRTTPALRDSAQPEYAVVALADPQSLPRRLTPRLISVLIGSRRETTG